MVNKNVTPKDTDDLASRIVETYVQGVKSNGHSLRAVDRIKRDKRDVLPKQDGEDYTGEDLHVRGERGYDSILKRIANENPSSREL